MKCPHISTKATRDKRKHKMSKAKKHQKILDVFEIAEDALGDVSDELLFQVTADMYYNETGQEISNSDIADALYWRSKNGRD